MQPDPEYLRQHYALLSDEALLELDRDDLIEVAQQLYDHEIARRGLSQNEEPEQVYESHALPRISQATSDDDLDGDQPDWHEEASDVYSSVFRPGSTPAEEVYTARGVLKAAGIPCYLDIIEEEDGASRCRVMVPGKLNFRAHSLLQKEMSNANLADAWKTHLEVLPDDELEAMSPREVFCDLYDMIERVTKIYNEELARRRMTR